MKLLSTDVQQPIRQEICDRIEKDILNILEGESLHLSELIWLLGQTFIDIGVSLGKLSIQSYAEAARAYIEKASPFTAMVAIGAMMHEWLVPLRSRVNQEETNEGTERANWGTSS